MWGHQAWSVSGDELWKLCLCVTFLQAYGFAEELERQTQHWEEGKAEGMWPVFLLV